MSSTISAHNRPYLMTMAAAASKQGIILDRLSTALLLVSSKGPRDRAVKNKTCVFFKILKTMFETVFFSEILFFFLWDLSDRESNREHRRARPPS